MDNTHTHFLKVLGCSRVLLLMGKNPLLINDIKYDMTKEFFPFFRFSFLSKGLGCESSMYAVKQD